MDMTAYQFIAILGMMAGIIGSFVWVKYQTQQNTKDIQALSARITQATEAMTESKQRNKVGLEERMNRESEKTDKRLDNRIEKPQFEEFTRRVDDRFDGVHRDMQTMQSRINSMYQILKKMNGD